MESRTVLDPSQEVEKQTTKGKPPINKYDLLGLHIDVWENETDKGKYKTFTLSRVYKDEFGQFKTQQIQLDMTRFLALGVLYNKTRNKELVE